MKLKAKFAINQYVSFKRRGRIVKGKIKEITLFRRDNTIGYGVASGREFIYIPEMAILKDKTDERI